MRELAWINGEITDLHDAKVPFLDHGYFFGYGVYEALKTYHGKVFAVQEHMDRLERSMSEINIKPQESREDIINAMNDLIAQSQLTDAMVYLQITRGVGPRTHAPIANPRPTVGMFVAKLPTVPDTYRHNGVKAIITKDERWAHPHIKTLNLLPNILAKQVAESKKAYEAIFVRDNAHVTEAASSNVFAVFGNTIVTPPADGRILNGITRKVLLRLLEQHQYDYKETYITEKELRSADEVFVTNTGAEVLAVTQLDDAKVGKGVPGKITQELYRLFMTEVERRIMGL